MGTPVGGGLRKVKIGARTFKCPADHDPNRNLGGAENTIQMNGDGTVRISQEEKPWLMKVQVVIDDKEGDQEYLQDLIDRGVLSECKFEYRAAKWGGEGTVAGELTASGKDSTAEITLSGPGKLEQL